MTAYFLSDSLNFHALSGAFWPFDTACARWPYITQIKPKKGLDNAAKTLAQSQVNASMKLAQQQLK
jgi:hypothetical protein